MIFLGEKVILVSQQWIDSAKCFEYCVSALEIKHVRLGICQGAQNAMMGSASNDANISPSYVMYFARVESHAPRQNEVADTRLGIAGDRDTSLFADSNNRRHGVLRPKCGLASIFGKGETKGPLNQIRFLIFPQLYFAMTLGIDSTFTAYRSINN